MLKTLRKTTWKAIKVGEVFAFKGCWRVGVKVDGNHARLLACDDDGKDDLGEIFKTVDDECLGTISDYWSQALGNGKTYKEDMELSVVDNYLYKLPKKEQRLWKQE